MPVFIDHARKYASLLNLSEKCVFEVADIRVNIAHFNQLDLVILGAVGQVLGGMRHTIDAVRNDLKPGGFLLINDEFLSDDLPLNDHRYLKKSQFYGQIISLQAEIIEERIFDRAFFNSQNNVIFTLIKKRVLNEKCLCFFQGKGKCSTNALSASDVDSLIVCFNNMLDNCQSQTGT